MVTKRKEMTPTTNDNTHLTTRSEQEQALSASSLGFFAKDGSTDQIAMGVAAGAPAAAGAGVATTITPLDFLGELEHGSSSTALAAHLKGTDTPTLRFSRDYAAELNRTED